MRKKRFIYSLITCMVMTVTIALSGLRAHAAEGDDWTLAYLEYIGSHHYLEYSDMDDLLPENGSYDLIYRDDSNVPQVLVSEDPATGKMSVLIYDKDTVRREQIESSEVPQVQDPQHLPYSEEDIIFKIRENRQVDTKTDWIAAYQAYLIDSEYLKGDQENFTMKTDISGLFYDLDADGIPEMILMDGYNGDYVPTYVYTYSDGYIIYLGECPDSLYASYKEGYEGPLYACTWADSNLYRISKEGNTINKEVVTQLQTDRSNLNADYQYVSNCGIDWMISELSVYEQLLPYFENPVPVVKELDDLLGWQGWWGSEYDYKTADFSNKDNSFWHLSLLAEKMKKYPGGVVKYDSWVSGSSGQEDPRGTMYGSYLELDADGMDRVLKEIYNVSDESLENLHKIDDDYFYYQDGNYYCVLGGVGGGYGSYIKKIEREGEVFQVTFTEVYYPDGPMGNEYTTKYALMSYKELEGKGYWSLYAASAKPVADRVGEIEKEFFGGSGKEEQTTEEVTTTEKETVTEEITTVEETTEITETEEETTEEPARGRASREEKEDKKDKSGFPLVAIIAIAGVWVFAIAGAVTAIVLGKKKKATQPVQQPPIQPVQQQVQPVQPVQQPVQPEQPQPVQQQAQPGYCPVCGAQTAPGQQYCSVCGKQLW